MLAQREQLTHEHGEPAIAGHRDYLPPGMRQLGADGLGKGVRHRTVRERTEKAALPVHREIPGRPDRGSAHVAGKDRIRRRKFVENAGYVLRVNYLLVGMAR